MAQPSLQPDPLLGATINDRFKILSLIAKGGMGKVYKAEQAPLGRIVAVKVLHPNYTGEHDPEFSKRFTLEASVVSRLKHPNTVTVYDYGQTADGVYFMAMEFLEGRTLHRLIREEGALETSRALHIVVQVARSLREAHGHGVIHRDLKPANIYLIQHDDDPDYVKVLDFGLVKNLDEPEGESLTKTGLFMGSPKYMAPEQIRGDRVTPATDVYALGVILFEMLAGKVPYDRPNSANLLLAHVNEPVPTMQSINPLVSVPAAVEAIVYRCMAKSPDERFQSMDELIVAIKSAGVPVAGLGPSLTGEYHSSHTSLSAPRASSGDNFRPAPRPVSGANPSSPPVDIHVEVAGNDRDTMPEVPSRRPPAEAPSRGPATGVMLTAVAALALAAAAVYALATKNAAPTTTTAPLAPSVHLVLESDPSGAEVLEHGAPVGRTPLRETWTGARANPAETHTFTFRLAGHADAVVSLTGSTLVHLARLQRIDAPVVQALPTPPPEAQPDAAAVAPTPRRAVVRPNANARGRADAGHPAGYRPDPYDTR